MHTPFDEDWLAGPNYGAAHADVSGEIILPGVAEYQ
jgi:hypothetical protein